MHASSCGGGSEGCGWFDSLKTNLHDFLFPGEKHLFMLKDRDWTSENGASCESLETMKRPMSRVTPAGGDVWRWVCVFITQTNENFSFVSKWIQVKPTKRNSSLIQRRKPRPLRPNSTRRFSYWANFCFLRAKIFDLQQHIFVSSAKLTINLLTNEKFALKTFLFVCVIKTQIHLQSVAALRWGPESDVQNSMERPLRDQDRTQLRSLFVLPWHVKNKITVNILQDLIVQCQGRPVVFHLKVTAASFPSTAAQTSNYGVASTPPVRSEGPVHTHTHTHTRTHARGCLGDSW